MARLLLMVGLPLLPYLFGVQFMLLKKTLLAAAAIALGGFSSLSFAGASPQSATFTVTATVIKGCTVSATNIAFGNYDPTSATAVTAQGAVTAKCTKGSVVAVALDQGLNAASGSTAATPARQMKDSSGDLLAYHIYTTSGGSTEWGNTSASEPATQTSTSAATALTFTTYGSLPAGQDVPAATSYTDTVTATLTF